MSPIWTKTPATASRLRGRLQKVLAAAAAQGLREGPNPAAWSGHLDAVFPRVSKLRRVTHHAAVPVAAMPKVAARLAAVGAAGDVAASAALFQILCACRPGEARGLRWEEIDLEAAIWKLPAARHKTSKPWRCPLSRQALAILKRMAALRISGEPLVFPGRKIGRPVSLSGMRNQLWAAGGTGATLHGSRSTFSDFSHERTDAKKTVIDHALGHGPTGTTAAYWRSDMLADRAKLMRAWGDYCHG